MAFRARFRVDELPIARFRYSARTKLWTLYRRDRNLLFHLYDRVAPNRSVDALLPRWIVIRLASSGAELARALRGASPS